MNTLKAVPDDGKSYREGPLDETFGQHAVFPTGITQESSLDKYTTLQVQQYLHQVRQEAVSDSCIHYVERDNATPQKQSEDESPTYINPDWSQSVMKSFLQLKESIKHADFTQSSDFPPVPQSAANWRSFVFQNDPPPIEYFYVMLDHPTIIKLVVYFTKWISINSPETLSKWIFSVFLRLDNPLEYTESSIIRDLGKKARKLSDKVRSRNNDNDNDSDDNIGDANDNFSAPPVAVYTIELILVVIGEYYGQKDLLFI